MSHSGRRADSGRLGFILALVAFLSVSIAVCGGLYRVYQGGALSAVLESNGRRALLLGTRTPTPTAEESPTVLPTITPREPSTIPSVPPASATPSVSATPSKVPTPAATATLTPTVDPLAGSYSLEYSGCLSPGGSTFKGRVFDRQGSIIVGAHVFVTLDGWAYDVPAVSNDSGWYELYLTNGQNVEIVRLVIGGQEQTLATQGLGAVPVRPECYQEVNIRQH